MDPEDQIKLAVRLEDVAGHGGLPGHYTGVPIRQQYGPGGSLPDPATGSRALAAFCAVPQNGAMVLATLNGKSFNQSLSTHPAGATVPTTAANKLDAAVMARDLIQYLNKGTWGGANRGGHTLFVDLDAKRGDVFTVF
jgi:hypothetical protein